jgi:hypothetical protein
LVDDRSAGTNRVLENGNVLSPHGNEGYHLNNKLNARERLHLARVKNLSCSVCEAPGPSEAHHYKQGLQYTCIALCVDCHRNPVLGWHGQKRAWAINKMAEIDALNETIRKLCENMPIKHDKTPF